MSTSTKSRKVRKPETFKCLFQCGADTYAVKPLAADAEVASKAFRLHKQTGDGAIYDVRLTPHGLTECDCPGHTRWGHCKHVRMLTALGCLPETKPSARSTGDLAANHPDVYEQLQEAWSDPSAPPPWNPDERELEEMAAHFGQ